jgi:parallel beta-helix repeat protein
MFTLIYEVGCDSVVRIVYLKGIYRRRNEKNRKATSLALTSLLIFGAFVGMLNIVTAMGQQHNIWGTAYEGASTPGTQVLGGRNITAWVDGVTYGYNITTITSEIDLYVDGDWFGLTEEQAVKDGGYEGDEIMYFLDYDPTDYYFSIADWTSFFNTSDYENIDLFFDTETHTDTGTAGDTYLRGLKINEIVLDPADGLTPYVYLFDPGGELDEISIENNYYLQKDNDTTHTPDGNIFNFAVNRNDVQQRANNYYYINFTDMAFSLSSADELKLVWRNPGNTTDDIANNTNVIVDRVEWGNYVNFFDDTPIPIVRDHDNTTLLDFINVSSLYGSGASMLRTDNKSSFGYSGNGTDTDNCFADFKVLEPATPRPQQLSYPAHNINSNEYFHGIQAAIDDPDTQDGHTISVAAGTYTEELYIDKSISLVGYNRATTTINGMVTLNKSSVDIQNFKIVNPGSTCLQLEETFSTNIQNLWLADSGIGISCLDSDNVTIQDNIITNNTYGIDLNWSYNLTIVKNTISQNRESGLHLSHSTATMIYHNNIISNKQQAYDDNDNQWDNGYPSGGNFWSDYKGFDEFRGSSQNLNGNDGIGDTNYSIDSDSVDFYPLKSPFGPYVFLYKDWNLISFPYIQLDTNLESILSSIDGNYNAVKWYDISDNSDSWKHNHISKPPNLNDFQEINHIIGFWIFINKVDGVLFEYSGTQPTSNQTISLHPGWNMVGYPSLTSCNRTEGLNNLTYGDHVDAIWSYDASTQKWEEMGESDYFKVGMGYYIHAKSQCEWEVPL